MVGFKYEQLEQLINQALALQIRKQQEREVKKVRIINKGGGRKLKLSTQEQILLTWIYLRHLRTFELLGIQFKVSESTANDTFNHWDPIWQSLLPSSLLESLKKNASDYEIVEEILTEYELIVDSCEQPREGHGEDQEQKKYYSGKKKSQTFKNQIIVLPSGKDIVDVIAGQPGPKSDISLFREGQKGFDSNQRFKGDKAERGELSIKTPTKKQKKGELSQSQKDENKEMAADRIFVEHLIRSVKMFRVAAAHIQVKSR